jgi:hypothetical protein
MHEFYFSSSSPNSRIGPRRFHWDLLVVDRDVCVGAARASLPWLLLLCL